MSILHSLVTEQEWNEFWQSVLNVKKRQTEKLTILRDRVKFNLFRPLVSIWSEKNVLGCIIASESMLYLTVFSGGAIFFVLFLILEVLVPLVCILLDLILCVRFIYYREYHRDYLLSVINAHTDDDLLPDAIIKELLLELETIAAKFSEKILPEFQIVLSSGDPDLSRDEYFYRGCDVGSRYGYGEDHRRSNKQERFRLILQF